MLVETTHLTQVEYYISIKGRLLSTSATTVKRFQAEIAGSPSR